mmetsp:Transcript_70544/g.131976  ORF Transcript_70544/g.131976 Transcript_70544/m.131976 type:complete len:399 (+) Transcript_70544:166-1362(+)
MPRKERPQALPESIFQEKPAPGAETLATFNEDGLEIPVHNTFIQFATPGEEAGKKALGLVTAPAWMGPSLQSIVAAAAAIPPPEAEEEEEVVVDHPEREGRPELASPKKIPVMRYAMSASSARAAGFEGSTGEVEHISSVAATYDGMPSLLDNGTADASKAVAPDDKENDDDDEESDGDDSETERIRILVEKGELPSMGSKRHLEGQCKRCCFFPKGRCLNGYDCEFCHFEHEKRRRKKKKKKSKAAAAAAETPEGASDVEEAVRAANLPSGIAIDPSEVAADSVPGALNTSSGMLDGFSGLGSPVKVSSMSPPALPPKGVPAAGDGVATPGVEAPTSSALDPNAVPFYAGQLAASPYGCYDSRFVDPALAAIGHIPGTWDPYMPMVASARPTFPPPR